MSNTTNSTELTRSTPTATPQNQWDPNKTYILNPTDTFTFTGPEFNFMYQCLLTYGQGSITDMKAIRAIQDCFTVLHGRFVELVENGTIRERSEETNDSNQLTTGNNSSLVADTNACLDKSSGCNSELSTSPATREVSREVCCDSDLAVRTNA
jgi:hypothetical protein